MGGEISGLTSSLRSPHGEEDSLCSSVTQTRDLNRDTGGGTGVRRELGILSGQETQH